MLHSLDCRVVAVEPQERRAAEITQAHVDHPHVHVVGEAVGAARGTADLFLANTSSEHASMAPEWMSAMRESDRMPDTAWTAGTVRVPVTTLDLLIERYGMPDLLKLDIEGLEPEALKGLSSPLAAVLFKFHHESLTPTKRSIERLEALGSYEFNYTVGEWLTRRRPDWVSGFEVLRDLEEFGVTGWGNVVARERSGAVASTE